jgi:hypothetical protein
MRTLAEIRLLPLKKRNHDLSEDAFFKLIKENHKDHIESGVDEFFFLVCNYPVQIIWISRRRIYHSFLNK